ncbi:MAG: hypothetical protein PHS44_07330 [Candidatus Dojkabacteria bacterium]|nr:hypothetical protein [Candidatus Dojkabacteria bacterium]
MSELETRSNFARLISQGAEKVDNAFDYVGTREGFVAVLETSISMGAGMLISTVTYDESKGINTWSIGLPALFISLAGVGLRAKGNNVKVPEFIEFQKNASAIGKTLMNHLGFLLKEIFTRRRSGYISIHWHDLLRCLQEERQRFDINYLAKKKAFLIHSGRIVQR